MYEELLRILRKEFIEKELQKKTNWGRIELTAAYDKCATKALARVIDSVPCLKPKTKGA